MSAVAPSHQTLRLLSQLCTKPKPRSCHYPRIVPSAAHRDHCSPRRRPFSSSCHPSSPSSSATSTSRLAQGQDAVAFPTNDGDTATLPDTSTFYTLFPSTLPHGPPPHPSSSFTIDLATLRREFLALQSRFHPDKYDSASATHRQALALSSLINNAYRTLADPLLRAQYLLHLRYGIDVTSEDNSHFQIDQATLMEVMDAQEAVEEAQSSDEVAVLKEENKQRMDQTIRRIGQAFEGDDKEQATRECVRLKYWRSLQQALDDWEPGQQLKLVH
ncbi:hypothetical protein DV735_g1843, partial [Chaetothyriales sp. CBS 134920]